MLHKLKRLRRFLAFALALVMAAAFTVPVRAASVGDFTDVPSGAWYYDAVSFAASKGLFTGTTATTFTPNGTMTRGMFIAVLGRYAGVDPDVWRTGVVNASAVYLRSGPGTDYSALTILSGGTAVTLTGQSGDWYKISYGTQSGYMKAEYVTPRYHAFSDVDYGAYYAGYAIWGYETGIVDGMGSADVYAPSRNVTREQICKLLIGYAAFAGLTLPDSGDAVSFTDASQISSWAVEGVTAMQRAGVVVGEQSGTGYAFRPKSSATRAEAATIFRRFDGAAVPAETGGDSGESGESGESGGDNGGTTPSLPADTPATFLSDGIAVKSDTIRAGILVNTRSYSDAVSTVTLRNTNGSAFEYGTFASDRRFVKAGEIASATVTVTSNGSTFTVKNASGTTVYTTTGSLALHPVSGSKAVTQVNGNYRYYGDFELRQAYNAAGYISVVNYVNIEDYVKGVVPYEFSNGWPLETLKAAAIAARTLVMAADWSIYASYGFDIMTNSSAQVYRGRAITYAESYFSQTDAAVEATENVYLTYSSGGTNRLCQIFYFSSDGGATEDAAHIWGGSYSYLIGKRDPYEEPIASVAGNYTYSITQPRTGSALTQLASSAGLSGTKIAPDGIRIETYPATGNVKSITLTGTNGRTAVISQSTGFTRWNFLSAFGFTAYSYNFSVTYNAAADTFTCTRLGWGHNVGLSQWGAYAMARYYGKSYQDILGFYYDGTHLQYGVS